VIIVYLLFFIMQLLSMLFFICVLSMSVEAGLSMTDSSHVFKENALLSMRRDVNRMHRAQPEVKHSVIFAVFQRNIPELERVLSDVSDPTSENYGKHWTRAEVGAFTSNPVATKAVLDYLSSMEVTIDHRTLYDEYITATGSVAVWESLFNTEFNVYTLKAHSGPDLAESDVDVESEHKFIRTESYSLPSELSEHVTAVFNTVQFPELRSKRRSTVSDSKKALGDDNYYYYSGNATGVVTPQLLYEYYSISNPVGSAQVSQAVFETGDDAMNPDDLTVFQQAFNLKVEAISQDIGGHVSTLACNSQYYSGCYESNLDVQYIMAISQSTPTTYYYYDFISWSDLITTVADIANPSNVYSISWGSYEITVASSYKDSFKTEAIKLGVMGTTLVAASGDDGVIAQSNSGSYLCGYYALFPASCPYVTAVGGTVGPESNNPEIACTSNVDESILITSGGGFSSYYDAPDFQKPFIKTYFSAVDGTSKQPSSGSNMKYNPSGRGYPDVALMAHNYIIAVDGSPEAVDGTSASTPVFAGMLSLVNSQRVAAGKSTLGWVNPLLYKYYASFTNDITEGDKNGCSKLNYYYTCCQEGFYPTTGWDPITGLGSVNVEKFSALFATLTLTSTSSSSSSKSLSTGAIIGISIAAFAVACLLVFGIILLLKKGSLVPSAYVVPVENIDA